MVSILVGTVVHANGHETRRDQRLLCLLGPIDDHVEVSEGTQCRARIAPGDLEAFHEDERAVVGCASPLQGDLRGEGYCGGETFVGGEILRDGLTEGSKALRGEQVEAVRSKVDEGRRAFDHAVHGSPERVVGEPWV